MPLRPAHGRAADLGRLVVNERPEGLEDALPVEPALPQHDGHGHFVKGNKFAKHSKSRAGLNGTLMSLEAKADPAWQAARQWGRRAGKHRVLEYGQAHGPELSHGVCQLLAEAAEMRGDAHYIRARAAADNNPDLLRTACVILASARQSERDAWELAVREAAARKAQEKVKGSPLLAALNQESGNA